MTDTPKYTEQWDRVGRWFERFKEISKTHDNVDHIDIYQDDVYAFFLNCYHLKDWIKKDPSAGKMSALVEEYINKSEALKICADLCNGLKHLTLTDSRSGQYAKFGGRTHKITLGTESTKMSLGYLIVTAKNKYDAYDIAEQCMLDWTSFFVLNRQPA